MDRIVEALSTTIIDPTFGHLAEFHPGLDSPAARTLLLGTALTESNGREIFQRGNGPAVSLFQIEPATFDDVWNRYLAGRSSLRDAIAGLVWPGVDPLAQLPVNQRLACAIARIRYWMVPPPMPEADNLPALARYWKDHYNTAAGAGTPMKFVNACRTHGVS